MIQDIFLPERIGSYYIFRQRLLGLDITKTHVHGTLVIASGSNVTISKQESASLSGDASHDEKVIAALPTILEKVGKVDHIVTAMPSSLVVFKELRLPFTTRDKIAMVIRFEVEPLLPFPPHEAVIDFIITKINTEDKSSQILVAAAQKKHVAEQLSLLEQAGCAPEKITVDMFALYGLYSEIPTYQNLNGLVVLIDLNVHTTSIVTVHEKQIRIIRTLPYGLSSVAKDAGTSADLKPQQVMDHLLRFGSKQGGSDGNEAIQKSLSTFFNKIQFALSSTVNQLQNGAIEKILLCGPGAEIKNIANFAQEHLGSPCELFDYAKLTENKKYRIAANVNLSQPVLLSTAIAIPTPAEEGFNLRTGDFALPRQTLLIKQLVTACVLTLILFGTMITHNIIQTRRLRSEIAASSMEAEGELKERFKDIPEDEDELDEVLSTAKNELTKEEKTWRTFSSETRASFLEYLLELSTRINKEELGFIPEELTIVDSVPREIILKAKVRDYPELTKLEQVLKESKLFTYVESPSEPKFTMKIIAKQST